MKNITNKQIRVFVPATVANVACGFDILGFAIEKPGDEMSLKLTNRPGVQITKILGDGGKLSKKADQNTAGISANAFLQHIKSPKGLEIELVKKMPLGSGLGSSAASSVASVFGANLLLGEPLKKEELLPFALLGEKFACGVAHADNAAPALLGGFVLVRGYTPLDVIQIQTPKKLHCSIFHPQIEIRTEDARKILKRDISLGKAIEQWGNIAGLIAGLMRSDYELIGRSMRDVIIEPVRSILIPGFTQVKNAVLAVGALGCSISGSGPSVFAFSSSKKTAMKVVQTMKSEFASLGVDGEGYCSKINQEGPRIISDENHEIL